MAKEEKDSCDCGTTVSDCCKPGKGGSNAASGGLYGMGFLGALIYFIAHAGTFWIGVLGFLKALVWPAILVYKLLEYLKL